MHFAVAESDFLDLALKLQVGDVIKHDLSAETLSLLLHFDHEVWALNTVSETGVVLDLGGFHELATRFDGASDH